VRKVAINKSNGLAIILIVIGALMLLDKIGLGLGHVLGFLFPFILIGLGVLGIVNGKRWIGWALVVIGGISLLGKLWGLLSLILAIVLIVFGIRMLKRRGIG